MCRHNPYHVLHQLLPQPPNTSRNLRQWAHNLTLPTGVNAVTRKNCVSRMLFLDSRWFLCVLLYVVAFPRVGPECVLCPRIDLFRFLAGCRRRRLNQGLVVALCFFLLLDRACFCVIFLVYGCMLCLVRYLFVISTSVVDCLGRFVPEMTCCVSSGTLNLAQLNSTHLNSSVWF